MKEKYSKIRRLGLPIESILSYARGFWLSQVVMTAVELDIFTVCDSGPLTAIMVAEPIETEVRATAMLLDALVSLGLLQKEIKNENWHYFNTHTSSQYLVKDKPNYIGWIILHHKIRYPPWGN
ncbi:MAG TPA: methyltransferase dimerization domain-containing protein, partial [Candidatus Hodarchaeales archaeon]|nr:methyltransferase dimerization domain-containing protein [Candidatus Hodarchaeales archaeon]